MEDSINFLNDKYFILAKEIEINICNCRYEKNRHFFVIRMKRRKQGEKFKTIFRGASH